MATRTRTRAPRHPAASSQWPLRRAEALRPSAIAQPCEARQAPGRSAGGRIRRKAVPIGHLAAALGRGARVTSFTGRGRGRVGGQRAIPKRTVLCALRRCTRTALQVCMGNTTRDAVLAILRMAVRRSVDQWAASRPGGREGERCAPSGPPRLAGYAGQGHWRLHWHRLSAPSAPPTTEAGQAGRSWRRARLAA